MSHTPGKWEHNVVYEGISSKSGWVCSIGYDHADYKEGGIKEVHANARLIAAAPDLLVACEKAERVLDALFSFYGQGLEVVNWHLNGDTEPLDNFIDDNSDGTELELLRTAIAATKGQNGVDNVE